MSLASRAQSAEILRIQSRYKRLVLMGKVSLPWAIARRLVGPDCAYHLYSHAEVQATRQRRQRA
jgi:hypothetical protein